MVYACRFEIGGERYRRFFSGRCDGRFVEGLGKADEGESSRRLLSKAGAVSGFSDRADASGSR